VAALIRSSNISALLTTPSQGREACVLLRGDRRGAEMLLPPIEWTEYRRRIRDEHAAGWLTRAHHDVLVAIADLVAAGQDQPTVAAIALWARCSDRTVRLARSAAEARGLLVVEEQHEPAPEGAGRKRWQVANRYALAVPSEPVRPKPRQPRGGQRGRPSREGKKERRPTWVDVDLLAVRRAVMNERLMGLYGSKRLLR
jgi:hypothetical protein